MVTVRKQLRAGGRRVAEWFAPTVTASLSDVPHLRAQSQQADHRADEAAQRIEKLEHSQRAAEQQIRDLQDRVASLEAEVQEARRLNRYVAEVTDVVQEVLLPAANRDDDRLKEFLTRYADSF